MELGEISWGRGICMKEEKSTYGGECTCGDVESDEKELASTPGRKTQGGKKRSRSVLYQKPSIEREKSGRNLSTLTNAADRS